MRELTVGLGVLEGRERELHRDAAGNYTVIDDSGGFALETIDADFQQKVFDRLVDLVSGHQRALSKIESIATAELL